MHSISYDPTITDKRYVVKYSNKYENFCMSVLLPNMDDLYLKIESKTFMFMGIFEHRALDKWCVHAGKSPMETKRSKMLLKIAKDVVDNCLHMEPEV